MTVTLLLSAGLTSKFIQTQKQRCSFRTALLFLKLFRDLLSEVSVVLLIFVLILLLVVLLLILLLILVLLLVVVLLILLLIAVPVLLIVILLVVHKNSPLWLLPIN